MTPKSRLFGLMVASAWLSPALAYAQNVGGAVPPYQPPPQYQVPQKAAPEAAGGTISPFPSTPVQRENVFQSRDQLVSSFSAAYQKAKKPRIAIFWNRELTDALDEWYGNSRTVVTQTGQGSLNGNLTSKSLSGDLNLSQSGSSQTTIENQQRTGANQRIQPSESWDWQFQEGFIGPFLKAGAHVVDRAAIVRLTGVNAGGNSGPAIETKALQSMADLLIEVLVSPQGQSTTGYELRARVLETNTGRILAYVNSRGLKEWNQPKEAIATNQGFILPDDDDDDESFGPQASETKYRATAQGFTRSRKPPKLSVISQNLSYNVMDSLMGQWR